MIKSILTACCVALAVAGCGPTNAPMTKEQGQEHELTQVGDLCRMYQHARKKAPTKLTDLDSVRPMASNGYEAIKAGRVVLLYGATLPDTKEEPGVGPDDEVLAYDVEVPQSGGKVLMLNRTIKTMTADEFKSAKKAGKEPAQATKKAGA